jgi:hypothetical protein
MLMCRCAAAPQLQPHCTVAHLPALQLAPCALVMRAPAGAQHHACRSIQLLQLNTQCIASQANVTTGDCAAAAPLSVCQLRHSSVP